MPHTTAGGGFSEFGEFRQPLQAGLRALRGRRAEERAGLARATSRVRTSGVRFIPQRTLEAGAAGREEALVGRFGLQSALSRIQDRRILAQRAFEREQSKLRFSRLSGLQSTLGRQQLQSQLFAGGLTAFGSAFGPGGALAGQQAGQALT